MILENIYKRLKTWSGELAVSRDDPGQEQKYMMQGDNDYNVEEILYLEKVMRFCYESLAMLVHNRTIRQQYRDLFQCSIAHEQKLKKALAGFVVKQQDIEGKHQGYALSTADLNVESLLDLGLAVAGYKLDIYRDLRCASGIQNRILFDHLMAHVLDEINFLNKEKEMRKMEISYQ